jgi:large subunit ribosomal protein L32
MSGALPKKRKSNSRRNQRRAHIRVVVASVTTCAQCKSPVPNHTACPVCGTYRGRTVIDIAAKEAKQLKKEKARKREAAEQGRK